MRFARAFAKPASAIPNDVARDVTLQYADYPIQGLPATQGKVGDIARRSLFDQPNQQDLIVDSAQVASDMDSIDFGDSFENLPPTPPISLRGGNAMDDGEVVPPFDPAIDRITPEYFEAYSWGIPYLDPESWRFYLPHFLRYALENLRNPCSNALDAFLSSLRPPDREPPRLATLSDTEERAVAAVLDRLAFSDDSEWKMPAMIALEEYWAPGANYRCLTTQPFEPDPGR